MIRINQKTAMLLFLLALTAALTWALAYKAGVKSGYRQAVREEAAAFPFLQSVDSLYNALDQKQIRLYDSLARRHLQELDRLRKQHRKDEKHADELEKRYRSSPLYLPEPSFGWPSDLSKEGR